MKVMTTIALLALFVLATTSTFAQDVKTTETNTTLEVKQKAAESETMPYLNYNGIQDSDQAKQAWIKDHPKEYAAMQGEKLPPYHNYKGIENIEEAKKAWIQDHPEEYKKSQPKANKK